MTNSNKYDFSYTGFSLRPIETIKVAKYRLNSIDFDAVQEIGGGNSKTTKNFINDINKRLDNLTQVQLEMLIDSDLTSQKQILFLAVCKTHHFIRDFTIEVLREKVLLFDYDLTDWEYISFFRRKSDIHTYMEDLTNTSQKKIKQVTFKILEQAGLIDDIKTKSLQFQLLDDKLVKAIVQDNKELLKLFFWSDLDIKNI
jgi:uncharacterized SAM-dependent methyltransferase